ncbi:MAG: hypothetical protein JXB30_00530 [Anaerolineae bacterium]|nr:hypothetical protein [Anaerolineae bacterium]
MKQKKPPPGNPGANFNASEHLVSFHGSRFTHYVSHVSCTTDCDSTNAKLAKVLIIGLPILEADAASKSGKQHPVLGLKCEDFLKKQ